MKRKLSSLNEKAGQVRANYENGRKLGVVWRVAALCFVIAFLGEWLRDRAKSTATVDSIQRAQILSAYGKLPIQFIENQGQYPQEVKYYFSSPNGTIYFTSDAVVMQFMERLSDSGDPQREVKREVELRPSVAGADGEPDSETQSARGYVIRKRFVGTNPGCRIEGSSTLPGKVNIFRGNDPSQWKIGIPTFKELIYHNLYPGIDLVYKGVYGRLKYDLIVYPGADVSRVRFTYEGVDSLEITESGALTMSVTLNKETSACPLHEERKPIIYQEIGGKRIFVDGEYHLLDDGSIGLHLFAYDPAFPVVIDPATDLVYSTFLGGGGFYERCGITIDESGNAYIAGSTSSPAFPTTPGVFDTTHNGDMDVFVTKLNADGSALVYSTFLGGGQADESYDIAIDGSGNAYITGHTDSSDFPITPGAFDTTYNGGGDVLVTKLNADGSALVYSTFLGGGDSERSHYILSDKNKVAIDESGNAYIAGCTSSPDFPTTPGAFDTTYNGGDYDAFVTKLNAAGSALLYSTFLGGGSSDVADGIVIDASGNAYITGYTDSSDFPVTPGAFDTTLYGVDDVFVTKLNPSGSDLVYSTFLGGEGSDDSHAIAIDESGNAYVTGQANSSQFPVTPGAFDTTFNYRDVFVTEVNADGSNLVYSTFLGGGGQEYGLGIAIDGSGNVYVTGWTASSDFPVTPGAFDTTHNGSSDVFVTRLNASGSALLYSTFLGGSSRDEGFSIAIDGSGSAYITGVTGSTGFPVTPGAFDTTYNGTTVGDVFVSKLYWEAMVLTAVEPALWPLYQ